MHRLPHTLTLLILLALTACSKNSNNVGTIATDGGDAAKGAQTGGTTTGSGGKLGSGGVASGGATSSSGGATSGSGGTTASQGGGTGSTADASQDSPDQVTRHPYVSNGATCINYPSAGYRTFQYDSSPMGDQPWPTCTLNCNTVLATAGAGQAPLDQALPDGPCDDEGATCGSPVMAGWCGTCANQGGPGNGYTCTCRGKSWQCVLVSQGANVCDPPTCVNPSLTIPYPLSCLQTTWSATQVCSCGACQDLCSFDGDCQSGHCNLNQVCRFPDSCKGSPDCRAACTGLCQPAPGDGGLATDGGVCAWPAGFTPSGDNNAVGCWASAVPGPVDASQLTCSSAEYGLHCVGDVQRFDSGCQMRTMPAPDSSLGCRVLPLPTAFNNDYYCCPCGQSQTSLADASVTFSSGCP